MRGQPAQSVSVDIEQRFPRAEAGEALKDADPEMDNTLEAHGRRIGSNGPRFR